MDDGRSRQGRRTRRWTRRETCRRGPARGEREGATRTQARAPRQRHPRSPARGRSQDAGARTGLGRAQETHPLRTLGPRISRVSALGPTVASRLTRDSAVPLSSDSRHVPTSRSRPRGGSVLAVGVRCARARRGAGGGRGQRTVGGLASGVGSLLPPAVRLRCGVCVCACGCVVSRLTDGSRDARLTVTRSRVQLYTCLSL